MTPSFFATPSEFREWLQQNHSQHDELLVGFYKRGAGRPSITWPEAVDQALCFGWIDGVRRSLDAISYTIRFTPRKPGSTWSAINIRKVKEFIKKNEMSPAGLRAFDGRSDEKSAIYSYEQRKSTQLPAAAQKMFMANKRAWSFFQKQPPWYRRTASYWVISAKREETRQKRLASLIDCSEHHRPIAPLTRPSGKKK